MDEAMTHTEKLEVTYQVWLALSSSFVTIAIIAGFLFGLHHIFAAFYKKKQEYARATYGMLFVYVALFTAHLAGWF